MLMLIRHPQGNYALSIFGDAFTALRFLKYRISTPNSWSYTVHHSLDEGVKEAKAYKIRQQVLYS